MAEDGRVETFSLACLFLPVGLTPICTAFRMLLSGSQRTAPETVRNPISSSHGISNNETPTAQPILTRRAFVQPDGNWHNLSSTIAGSRIKHRETPLELEINFKSISGEEAISQQGCLWKVIFYSLVVIFTLLCIADILLVPIALISLLEGFEPFAFKLVLASLLFTFIAAALMTFMQSIAYSGASHHWYMSVNKERIKISEKRFSISISAFKEEINRIERVEFIGEGNPFSDEIVRAVSMRVAVDTNSSSKRIALNASLSPSELEWLHNTINAKIQTLR